MRKFSAASFLLQWYDDAPIVFQVSENYFSCLIVVPNIILIQLFDIDFVNNFLHHALGADVIKHLLCPKLDISNAVMPFNCFEIDVGCVNG